MEVVPHSCATMVLSMVPSHDFDASLQRRRDRTGCERRFQLRSVFHAETEKRDGDARSGSARLGAALPAALLRRMIPTAPAACALTDLLVKLQPPRSATTIFPATSARQSLASIGEGTRARRAGHHGRAAVVGQDDGVRESNVCGPYPDAPISSVNVRGGMVTSERLPMPVHTYICIRGDEPSARGLMLALFDCPESAASCASTSRGSRSAPPRP